MKLTYLGTAAAEGWPAVFCNCENCKEAARLGGRNIRTRSQALVNDDLLLDHLDFFEERGIGIVNASPFSMGLLSMRGAPAWHPAPQGLKDACQRAAKLCDERGYPIDKLAIQYSTNLNPRIATTLFSSANPDNVRKNIAYVNEPMDTALVEDVKAAIGDQMRVRWKNS